MVPPCERLLGVAPPRAQATAARHGSCPARRRRARRATLRTVASDHEQRWLDHAWRVVDCPVEHRRARERHGGAQPGPDRVDGNELRWPGYLGRDYEPGRGVLYVGAVMASPRPRARPPTR